MADLTPDQLAKAIADALKANGSGFGGKATSSMVELEKELKNFTDGLKKSQQFSKNLNEAIRGNATAFSQNAESTTEELEKLNQALEKANQALQKNSNDVDAKSAKSAAIEAIQSKKRTILNTAAMAAVSGFTNALIDFKLNMLNVSMDFASGLVAGKTGNDLYTQSAIQASKANQDFYSSIFKTVEGLGAITALIPGFRLLGIATAALSAIFDRFSGRAQDLYAKGLETLNAQLTKTTDAFREVSNSGAILATGMTELTNLSVESGYGIRQFSAGVKNANDSIIQMGLGYDQAITQLAYVGKALHQGGGNLAKELDKLGVSMEDQVQLSADVMARLSAVGDQRALDENYVAEQTVEYAKSLKILKDITGESAREALKKAREESMVGAIYAKYAGIPGAMEKIQTAMVLYEKQGLKTALLQKLQYGNVFDAASNIAINQNKQIGAQLNNTVALITDQKIQGKEAMRLQGEYNAAIGQGARDSVLNNKELTKSMSLSKGVAKDAYDIQSKSLQSTLTNNVGKATADAKAIDLQAKNNAELDENVAEFTEITNRLVSEFDSKMLPQLGYFTDHIVQSNEQFNKFAESFDNVIKVINSFNSGQGFSPSNTGPFTSSNKSNTSASQSYPSKPAESVPPRPPDSDWKKQQIWDSKYASGWNPDGSPKTTSGAARIKGSESTAGGPTDPRVERLAAMIAEKFPKATVTAYNDAWHKKNRPASQHTQGMAADIAIPGLNKTMLNEINQLIAGVGRAEIHPNASGAGQHLHVEPIKTDGKPAKNPQETVSKTDNSRSVFERMNENLAELVRLMKTGNKTSDKLLKSTQ